MAKKKRYQKPKDDKQELEKFREHTMLINDKTKKIVEKYKKWWDKENGTWKKGFKGH